MHCHAGCPQDAVLAALRERGLWPSRTDPFFIETHRSRRDTVTDGEAEARLGLTLPELATAKRLPEGFLRQLGLRDVRRHGRPAAAIPYLAEDGTEATLRYRLSLVGDSRFRWQPGARVMPYGLQRLPEARRAGWMLLVEGESDCWTCWHHRLPALGIPGKSTWRPEWREHLVGLTVYLWQEPDAADLVEQIARDLPDVRVIAAPSVPDVFGAGSEG